MPLQLNILQLACLFSSYCVAVHSTTRSWICKLLLRIQPTLDVSFCLWFVLLLSWITRLILPLNLSLKNLPSLDGAFLSCITDQEQMFVGSSILHSELDAHISLSACIKFATVRDTVSVFIGTALFLSWSDAMKLLVAQALRKSRTFELCVSARNMRVATFSVGSHTYLHCSSRSQAKHCSCNKTLAHKEFLI